ncbi:hypothetical protein DEJ47_12755 [Streptomyces venezuelae]|uniref:GNAT family N-acetyltransferase n=2 Tax=Streptomyces venezuelae TaxID=54571 RepID=A0A5P2BNA3_STRVZ|nr:hypothetical protein DEJ47_12755 [Streptomyces venezuelae]
MRMLDTAAERQEAAALVQDRQGWLIRHGLPLPGDEDVPAQFRAAQTRSAGLFEDGRMLACLIPEHTPDIRWGQGPCLFLRSLYTLPGHPDDVTRLITLWASDVAARHGLPRIRAEVPTRQLRDPAPVARLLNRLIDMGWALHGAGDGQAGEVAHLELSAERRSGLHALLSCRVRVPQPAHGERSAT